MEMIDETQINRNTPFGDLPVGAVAIVMSVGQLVRVRKEVEWKSGSRCTNARKLDGRRGLASIWPSVLAHVVSLPTEQETAEILASYAQKEAGTFGYKTQ